MFKDMAEGTYKTIVAQSEGLFKDKGSKFLAYAYPVVSEEDVKTRLEALRKEHHAARHHCWAYKIGNHGEQFRCSDDGEPSNSAGKPILGQLESFGVTNVAVVVVRYFGGILLGVGGLMQAYKEATKDALTNAEIVEKLIQSYFVVNFSYEQNNAVMTVIKRFKCEILSQSFNEMCSLRCAVAQNIVNECVESLQKVAEVQVENG